MRLKSHLGAGRGSTSFREAMREGLASDGGLYMPTHWRPIEKEMLDSLKNLSFQETAIIVATHLLEDEIPAPIIRKMIEKAYPFEVVLKSLTPKISVLELFHGPTLAFKDFGARFMAEVFDYFLKEEAKQNGQNSKDGKDSKESKNKKVTILVATSGDTGSAVAQGFAGSEWVDVVLLYPKGKVSDMQERQLTMPSPNLTSLAINGTFDDCQRLVKEAFQDPDLRQHLSLSSANSINIARLVPQSFYYFYARNRPELLKEPEVVFSVPSGNLGNITGGLFAKFLGLDISQFIAAHNANDVFREYLEKGIFKPRPSVQTDSNAMDVGNPSNFARVQNIFDNNVKDIRNMMTAYSFTDQQMKNAIKRVYKDLGYLCDPHGAIGFLAAEKYLKQKESDNEKAGHVVFLETAHPAKFGEVVAPLIGQELAIPAQLQPFLKNKEKLAKAMSSDFQEFKEFLMGI